MNKSFSTPWWTEFININQNFTQACVMKNCIDDDLLHKLHEGVVEVINTRFKVGDLGSGFRLYLDGVEQKDLFLKSLSENLFLDGETISEYAARTFKAKFAFIINYGEKHSDLISYNILNSVQPLIDTIGLPASGLEITIFIGDYGWTPLGIHQDHRGENVIHFHLGPGKKKMYVWDENEYTELTGRRANNLDIEPLLKYSKEFQFGAGDIFYMPWNKFHVGYSDELSVGVTLWFNNPTKQEYFKTVSKSFFLRYENNENNEILTPQLNYLTNPITSEIFIDELKLDKDTASMSTLEYFKSLHQEFKYSLLSNGGWQQIPLSLEKKEKYVVDNYKNLLGKRIYLKDLFKIYYQRNKDTLYIYARGSKIEIRYHDELISIITKLNTGDVFLVEDLIDDLSKEWPVEAGLYFLSLLYDKRGFNLQV